MGFRFFRRVKIAPGLSLNLSRSGVSPSLGVRGARMTLGRSGVRKTVGIPGTGLYYTTIGGAGGHRRSSKAGPHSRNRTTQRGPDLDLNFFKRLTTPRSERAFIEGCKAYLTGRESEATRQFETAEGLADASFLAGMLRLKANQPDRASEHLEQALRLTPALSKLTSKYGLDVRVHLPITEEIAAGIAPSREGTLLALAEAYQLQGRLNEAIASLDRLRRLTPDNPLAAVSEAELLLESHPGDKRVAKRVVALVGEVNNESAVHTALLLYKARALRTLGLSTAARDTLTTALRRVTHRPPELLRAVRYERALTYEDLGHRGRARRDFETLFAEDPQYEDVAHRLGI